jgi:hypothetical protein
MMSAVFGGRSTGTVLIVAGVLAAAGCKDSHGPHDHEPDVVTMRLTVGTQVITVSDNGTVTGGPLVLQVGANTITAAFLGADGQPDEHVTPDEYELKVTVDGGAPIAFTRSQSNPFSGTLTATATVTGATVRFSLYHIDEGHDDFGPFPVTVNVN